jgi:DNA anti-recombination protein RmuC
MGLRGMQIEENAKRLYAYLAGMEKQMSMFTEVFERLGTHLKNAQQSYGEGEKRLERAQNTLEGLVAAGVADAALENAQGTLPLTVEASAKKSA